MSLAISTLTRAAPDVTAQHKPTNRSTLRVLFQESEQAMMEVRAVREIDAAAPERAAENRAGGVQNRNGPGSQWSGQQHRARPLERPLDAQGADHQTGQHAPGVAEEDRRWGEIESQKADQAPGEDRGHDAHISPADDDRHCRDRCREDDPDGACQPVHAVEQIQGVDVPRSQKSVNGIASKPRWNSHPNTAIFSMTSPPTMRIDAATS